ncbi:helix-turn-helix domain-containing protein [Amycolatopsis azurea]|uniref:Transcriptional regulator n=1 Tax=Amycolatopsis azurea DSM 43854 TaxID=1238180 RepID=A0ABX3JJ52_9PSEU|nr:helix-turn-helix transcriptional regulator [Amycolatopsis azurea]OOC07786.1 transcriptional regulator [Amycolatopsis azurea DSM 43854]
MNQLVHNRRPEGGEVPPPASPVVAAWELALRLRGRRDQLNVDVKTITATLGFSRNYWSAVENERKILSEESLSRLLTLLEFDDGERQELLDLRHLAKERGWWTQYSSFLGSEIQRMFGLELGAQGVRDYESLIIPGLLQTEDYARAIMTPAVVVRKVEVDQRVAVRRHRQERLSGENPLHITAIISEAALRQQIGGPAILRAQLDHLADMIEGNPERIRVRIIPFTAKSCGLFGASTVHMIDFDNARLPTVAWQETVTTWDIIDNPLQIRDITLTYSDAFGQALDEQQSLEMIHRYARELD